MAKEVFSAVQSAEAQAAAIVQEAQGRARDIIKEEEAITLKRERDLVQEQRALYNSLLDSKRTQMTDTITLQEKERGESRKAMVEKARTRLDATAQRIMERVMNDGNR